MKTEHPNKKEIEDKLKELSTLMYNNLSHDGKHWELYKELSNSIYDELKVKT